MAAEEWPPVAVVVPDDIRELAPDIAAYHRELRRSRRTRRVTRLLLTRRWARYGLSGPLLVVVLVVVGLIGSLMAVFAPRAQKAPASLPLAKTVVASGAVGGLLPDVKLVLNDIPVDARTLRPAVLFMVPASCSCDALVQSLTRQANEYALSLVLIAHDLDASQLKRLRDQARGPARIADDADGAMSRQYGGRTLVFVHADGRVTDIVHGPTATERYEPQMSLLTDAK